jgi:hypothetical protein
MMSAEIVRITAHDTLHVHNDFCAMSAEQIQRKWRYGKMHFSQASRPLC